MDLIRQIYVSPVRIFDLCSVVLHCTHLAMNTIETHARSGLENLCHIYHTFIHTVFSCFLFAFFLQLIYITFSLAHTFVQ